MSPADPTRGPPERRTPVHNTTYRYTDTTDTQPISRDPLTRYLLTIEHLFPTDPSAASGRHRDPVTIIQTFPTSTSVHAPSHEENLGIWTPSRSPGPESLTYAGDPTSRYVQSDGPHNEGVSPYLPSRPSSNPTLPPGRSPERPAEPGHETAAASTDIAAEASTPSLSLGLITERDAMLQYAYRIYESSFDTESTGLSHLPLTPLSISMSPRGLQSLVAVLTSWPKDKPTLLLLGCVYFALGDYEKCLTTHKEILAMDSECVEAMCNIGVTMRVLGKPDDALTWWRAALQLRPNYWVALENALGTLLNGKQAGKGHHADYEKARQLCSLVLERVMSDDKRFKVPVPPDELYRIQNTFYTRAMLLDMIGESRVEVPLSDFLFSIELAIRPPWPYDGDDIYTFQDLIMATYLEGLLMSHADFPQSLFDALSTPDRTCTREELSTPGFDILPVVHAAGARLMKAALPHDDGLLAPVLILPDQAMRLPTILFPRSAGTLPAICHSLDGDINLPSEEVQRRTHFMTSTVLLSLAKKLQEIPSRSALSTDGSGGVLRSNTSLVLLTYYLALSLSPSPSTFNNIGIVLSETSASRTFVSQTGELYTVRAPVLARTYYERGLLLHPTNPHLLTNLGSLLKDQGQPSEAMRLYSLAVQYQPDFTIALVNLGNSIKDTGRSADAIQYYQRAADLDPNLPEAVCGLAVSRNAVCDWRGRGSLPGDLFGVDDDGQKTHPDREHESSGWMAQVVRMTDEQIAISYGQNVGVIQSLGDTDFWLDWVQKTRTSPMSADQSRRWETLFGRFSAGDFDRTEKQVNEGGILIRFIEWTVQRIKKRWYNHCYGVAESTDRHLDPPSLAESSSFERLTLPLGSEPPGMPCILPFHTFGYPLSARTIRLISHRNAIRLSHTTLSQSWLPNHVYPPPPPPLHGKINIGYVSADLNNHPLSHLMQSVFGLHNRDQFNVYVYATSASDGTKYRTKIEAESGNFLDVSTWATKEVVERIVKDQIHILINLGGYTKEARNDVFAARPAPIEMCMIGFAGTIASGWCDYLVCDKVAAPGDMCAPERWRSRYSSEEDSPMQGTPEDWEDGFDFAADLDPESGEDWTYTERLMHMPHTFMVTDHKQSFRGDENLTLIERANTPSSVLWENEQRRRIEWRKKMFPDLAQDAIIFANFNQAYKIDPQVYAIWLRILSKVPNSILWLLRFPLASEHNLVRTAKLWAGEEVASRVRFTDVAEKEEHIYRGRVVDLFLDTLECNAHTVAADVLWSGTPLITWPKYVHKMSSRVGASIAYATGFGDQMVVNSLEEYEARAIQLANSVSYVDEPDSTGQMVPRARGALMDLRRKLFINRDHMPLFDTARWTRNIEKGYREAWRRWASGTAFEDSEEWEASSGPVKDSACMVIPDDDPVVFRD
ncbi:TPR-like protein [Artomyces pyxidatus]|uniref:TPR-like protein n=1 Tax=Artomyces pyxidatus TaxID=48021 RepID=A0ACB8TJ96_9AGAM|nr:TPR-like protein [Artomyces pyxidatus]